VPRKDSEMHLHVARCRVGRCADGSAELTWRDSRAAGSAIVVAACQQAAETWDVETLALAFIMPLVNAQACRTRRGANESSAAMQQSTVVGAVPAGL
jgi:hypothetical protein